MAASSFHGHADQAQDGRMEGIGLGSDRGVGAVGSYRRLREIVGDSAEKVYCVGQCVGHYGSSRDFNHKTDVAVLCMVYPVCNQIRLCLLDMLSRLLDLFTRGYHREHNFQVVPGSC